MSLAAHRHNRSLFTPRTWVTACLALVAVGAAAQSPATRGAPPTAAASAEPTIGERIRAAQDAAAAERQTAQAARQAREAAWAQAARGRTDIALRGVRLYMTLPELEAALRAETVAITPERMADWVPPEHSQYRETLRLADGSEVTVTISSTQTGSRAGAIGYVQTLRDGPPLDRLVEDFVARWGPPDETHAQGTWLTWHLKSRAATANGLGALLRAVVNTDRERKAERYTLTLSDYTFLRDDETRMAEARRAAEARQRESRKSEGVRF